jgi:hypothetical protein
MRNNYARSGGPHFTDPSRIQGTRRIPPLYFGTGTQVSAGNDYSCYRFCLTGWPPASRLRGLIS